VTNRYLLVVLAVLATARAQTTVPFEKGPRPGLPPARPVAEALLLGLPPEVVEGRRIDLAWHGPEGTVSTELLAYAPGPVLGGRVRDGQRLVLVKLARVANGALGWTPPFLDAVRLLFKLKAHGADGRLLGMVVAEVPYRPAALTARTDEGLLVWLSRGRAGQRLYVQREGRLVVHFACSGADGGKVLPVNAHPTAAHDHHGVFRAQSKLVDHVSRLNPEWRMRYTTHFLAGHAVHATTPNNYRLLGRPASHGCVRLHLIDAQRVFAGVVLGTRVEVF
jgi:hypothetical protein